MAVFKQWMMNISPMVIYLKSIGRIDLDVPLRQGSYTTQNYLNLVLKNGNNYMHETPLSEVDPGNFRKLELMCTKHKK